MKDRWHRYARMTLTLALSALLALSLAGCGGAKSESGGTGESNKPVEKSVVKLASTTSTQDAGLFDMIEPEFETAYPQYDLQITAVGTGQAIKLGETKDADVLLVHAKADEEKFVAAGFGLWRKDVMYNDFVIVGPKNDPAGIKGLTSVEAFKKIAETKSVFVSRGDDSGTNKKELKIWKAASIVPTATGDWYTEVGQGMGATLNVASEKQGYTLADRGTWLAQEANLNLALLVEGDKDLLNQYGVIPVKGAPNEKGGIAFAEWILTPEVQAKIGEFGKEKYGQSLFVPNAPKQ